MRDYESMRLFLRCEQVAIEWGIWHLPSDSWEAEVFSTKEEALAHCERNGEAMSDGRMDIEPREVTGDE